MSIEFDFISLLNRRFDHPAKKKRIYRYPIINWGRGRLLPYESLGAFAAKFCRLNGIKLREFRWFLKEFIEGGDWKRANFSAVAIKRLARLLDEKEAVVDKLNPNKLQLPGCYGTFALSDDVSPSFRKISYCPECISIGYHASFHEYPWFKKCPIHQTNLIREIVPFRFSGTDFDQYAQRIQELLDHGAISWLSLDTNSVVATQLDCVSFRQFVSWIKAAQRIDENMRASNIVALQGGNYSLDDIEILLGRIGWAIPPPRGVCELFHVTPKLREPVIVDYPIDVVNRLASLLTIIDYPDFSWFYRMTLALGDEKPKYLELVLKAVETIEIQGKAHSSDWGWSKESGWVRVDPDGWPYWNIITPSGLAVSQLRSTWTDFSLEDDSHHQRKNKWFRYFDYAKGLHKHGYVAPSHSSLNSPDQQIYLTPFYKPIARLVLDPDLKGLIEDLLYEEALAHIDDIQSWLNAIFNGAVPYKTKITMPSRGNLFLESERAYLFTWPTS